MNSQSCWPICFSSHCFVRMRHTQTQSSHLQQSGTYSLTRTTPGGVPRRGRETRCQMLQQHTPPWSSFSSPTPFLNLLHSHWNPIFIWKKRRESPGMQGCPVTSHPLCWDRHLIFLEVKSRVWGQRPKDRGQTKSDYMVACGPQMIEWSKDTHRWELKNLTSRCSQRGSENERQSDEWVRYSRLYSTIEKSIVSGGERVSAGFYWAQRRQTGFCCDFNCMLIVLFKNYSTGFGGEITQ